MAQTQDPNIDALLLAEQGKDTSASRNSKANSPAHLAAPTHQRLLGTPVKSTQPRPKSTQTSDRAPKG